MQSHVQNINFCWQNKLDSNCDSIFPNQTPAEKLIVITWLAKEKVHV